MELSDVNSLVLVHQVYCLHSRIWPKIFYHDLATRCWRHGQSDPLGFQEQLRGTRRTRVASDTLHVQRNKAYLGLCAQSHLTLLWPHDCSPPGSSVHVILQARILEWVAMPSSRGSSWPRDQTGLLLCRQTFYHLSTRPFPSPGDLLAPGTESSSSLAGEFFTVEPPGKPRIAIQ